MMGPSRLDALLALVEPVQALADIGSDHGLLPARLLKEGLVGRAIATDISAPSLGKAQGLLSANFDESAFETRLGDGLAPLEEGEVQALVLAGMGGVLISEILREKPDLISGLDYLILQPMQGQEDLFSWLNEEGFCLLDQALIREGDHFYPILKVKKGNQEEAISWASFRGEEAFLDLARLARDHYWQIEEGIKKSSSNRAREEEIRKRRLYWEGLCED